MEDRFGDDYLERNRKRISIVVNKRGGEGVGAYFMHVEIYRRIVWRKCTDVSRVVCSCELVRGCR